MFVFIISLKPAVTSQMEIVISVEFPLCNSFCNNEVSFSLQCAVVLRVGVKIEKIRNERL